jgi:hypothetical protein
MCREKRKRVATDTSGGGMSVDGDGDGVDQIFGRQMRQAFDDFCAGQSKAEAYLAGGIDGSAFGRAARTGHIKAVVLLRLDRHFSRLGRPGFLDRVYGRIEAPRLQWTSQRLAIDQIRDRRHRQLIEAARRPAENPREWLARTGLLARAHVLMLRGPDLISTHIGSKTLVSQALLGRDIRDRRDVNYARRTYEDVMQAQDDAVLHRIQQSDGDGYCSLRIPFREHAAAPLQIVALPFAVQSAGQYLVR